MYKIMYEQHRKWEEHFEMIHPDQRWEAMACLLAAELKKEREMSQYYKTLLESTERSNRSNV